MRLQEHYDWIVFGEQPAALLTASLVARMGLSVLVLPFAGGMKFSVSPDGLCFDPESNCVVGLGEHNGVRGLVLDALLQTGLISQNEMLELIEENFPQILTPESRIFFGNDLPELTSELQREGGSAAQVSEILKALGKIENEFLSYWKNLPQVLSNTLGTKTLSAAGLSRSELIKYLRKKHPEQDLFRWPKRRKKISRLHGRFGGSDFQSLAQGLGYWISSCGSRDPDLLSLVHLWSLSRVAHGFKGGITAYREFLVQMASKLGVHVPENVECKRIFVEKGRFAGVQLSNRGNMILGQGGILGCPLNKAYPVITHTGRSWLHRSRKGIDPVGWKFTLALTVHKESIPVGMKNRLVWQEEFAPIFEIEVANPEDYKIDYHVGGSDHRIIYLRTVMPFTDESLTDEFQRLTAARMMRQAMEMMPFLEYHVTKIYPEFRIPGQQVSLYQPKLAGSAQKNEKESLEEETTIHLKQIYGFQKLSEVPSNLFVYDPKSKSAGPSSGIEGLYVASEESYPDLGSFGALIAAFESVATHAQRMGLNRTKVDLK